MTLGKRILMIAGEASGDIYAGRLLRHLRRSDPSLQALGIGGKEMRSAGADLYADAEDLGVVGILEILPKAGVIFQAYWKTRQILRTRQVDLALLVDYPGLNIRIAKTAHQAGIPVIYYVSPQVWAWKAWRVGLLARRVDRMLVVFPFEEEIYRKAGLPCEFVGHPLVDDYQEFAAGHPFSQEEQRKLYGLKPDQPVIGIFPGSREGEVSHLLDRFVQAAGRVHAVRPGVQFLVAVAPTLSRRNLESHFNGKSDFDIRWIEEDPHGALFASDAVMAASGTITLQAALHEKPMVIAYRVSPLTWRIARQVVRVDHIGLPNIVAGKRIVPELLQEDASPEKIAGELLRFFDEPGYREKVRQELLEVKQRLGRPGASARAAKIVLDSL
jgi:lipid-A-disaccharide synthase